MKANIRVHLTYIFTIGFFVLMFLMFWVEASDEVNMKKGENSLTNEINILLGVVVASVGIIFRYWFNPKSRLNTTEKTALAPSQNAENEANPASYEIDEESIVPSTSHLAEEEADTSPPAPFATTLDVKHNEIKPPQEDKRIHLAFSILFFLGYFALLFMLLYLEFFASKKIVEGEDSLLDILLILIGVLTVSVGQILNYWFSKENRPAQDEVSKMLFHKLVNRPFKQLRNKEEAQDLAPKTTNINDSSPLAEPVKESAPIVEPVKEPAPLAEPVKEPAPIAEPVKEPAPIVEPVKGFSPIAQPEYEMPYSGGVHAALSFLLGLKGVNQAMLEQVSPFVEAFEKKYGINTPLRKAHFYAQLAHESGSFQRITENLNYSARRLIQVFPKYFPTAIVAEKYANKPELIANRVYASRMQNGNEASGDGYRYRGRGFIQMTGKANYEAVSKSLGVDFVSSPDLLLKPQYLLAAAGWFWNKNNLSAYADKDDVVTITKRINGGTHGLQDRAEKVKHFKKALGI